MEKVDKRLVLTNCHLCHKEILRRIQPPHKPTCTECRGKNGAEQLYKNIIKKCKDYISTPDARKRAKEWYEENKNTEHYKSYQARHKHSTTTIYGYIVKGARKRQIEVRISLIDFKKWYEYTPKICHYCDLPQEYLKICYPESVQDRLSIDRKDNGQYSSGNLCIACYTCNLMKSNVLNEQEMLEIGHQYIKPKWQSKLSASQPALV